MFYLLEVTTTDKVSKAVYQYDTLNEAKANFHSKLGSQMKSASCLAELVMVIEIYDAINSGKLCLIATNEYGSDILTVATSIATDNNTMYGVKVANNMYITNTENGYPAMRNA